MKLHLERTFRNDICTIGELFFNGQHECYVLEDVDRGLNQDMDLEEIKKIKVPHKTAIPTGTYKVGITFSRRFKKLLPEIFDVPVFSGIRIHRNTADNTDGCLLVGTVKDEKNSMVLNSRVAFNNFFPKLEKALKEDEVTIMIF